MSGKPAHGPSGITGGSVDGRANLKPWKPGVSGNPRGRPKVAEEVRSLARAHGQRALERLVELIDDPDPRVAFMASREVLDRAYGKATPATDIDDQNNKLTIVVKRFEYDAGAAVLAAPPRANEG